MKGQTALAKIRARTKQLQKSHPGKKYRTLQKQAAGEYNSGRLPKKRKTAKAKPAKRRKAAKKPKVGVAGRRKYKVTHRVNKLGSVKLKTTRRRTAPARRRTTIRTRTVTKYKRVGASKSKSMLPMIAGIAGVGLLAYFLLKPKSVVPPLVPSANAARNVAASNLVSIAQQAGTSIAAITSLVNAINKMTDSQVTAAAASVSSGAVPPASVADTFGNYNPYDVSTIDQYT